MRPRLFLDIDGTVNALQPANLWFYSQHIVPGAYGNRVVWSADLIDFFRESDFELYWTTMWLDAAADVLGPIIEYGEDAPHLTPRMGERAAWPTILWKRNAVEDHVNANPGPFVWLDDEMRPEDSEWARSVGGLAIESNVYHGVTPHHVEQIREYLAKL